MKKNFILLTGFCLMLSGSCVFAAPAGDASIQGRTNIQQLQQKEIEKKLIEPAAKPETGDAFKVAPQQNVVLEGGTVFNPQFTVTKIVFEGNTVIKSKKLDKLAKKLEGKEIYFEELLNFTQEVSKYYQSKGYLTSYASIPEQAIKGGVVTIKINESRVSSLDIEGEKWAREWYLRKVIMGKKGLKEGDVFSARPLQFAMKELMDYDYIEGAVSISKNKADGTTVLGLDVADRFPITLDMNWDNYGRSITGSQRFTAILGSQNLTGFGDKIYGGTILSSGSTGALAGYEIPISPYGTKLYYDFSYTDVTLGGPFAPLDITSKSRSNKVGISQPLLRTSKTDIIANVGLDFVHTDSVMNLFNTTMSDYDLRVLRSNIFAVTNDNHGRWIGNLGFDFGFHGLGASGNIPGGAESQFYKVTAGGIRVQRLPLDSIGIIRVSGQYTPNALYTYEQMQLGGPFNLRGYQPAELIGDYGVSGTAEIRTPIPGLKALFPKKVEDAVSDNVRFAVFYDFGYVKEHKNLYNYPQNFLSSVGAGLYVNLTKTVSAQFGLASPIGHKYYDEKSPRFYFGISTEFDKFIPLKKKQKDVDVHL